MIYRTAGFRNSNSRNAGMRYAALHPWIIGARTPRPDGLLQLADGLEARSDALRNLADELRGAAK